MFRLVFALSIAALNLLSPSAIAGVQPSAEKTALDAAWFAGTIGEVEPYPLLQSADGRTVVGAVYTQYVRVARYVWLARQKGEDPQVRDLPADVRASAIHVAMQLPAPLVGGSGPLMAAIHRPPTAPAAGTSVYFVPGSNRLIPASSNVAVTTLERIAGRIPVSRVGFVGTFPQGIASQRTIEFCVYNGDSNENYHLVSGYTAGPLR